MLRSLLPSPAQAIPTIKPLPEVINAIYHGKLSAADKADLFSQADRDLCISEIKRLLAQDKAAALIRPGCGANDVIILPVGDHLHARWLELSKVESEMTLETQEDFFILQYLLSQRSALAELNRKFNNCVLAEARAELAKQALLMSEKDEKFFHVMSSKMVNSAIATKNAITSLKNIFADKGWVNTIFTATCIISGLLVGMTAGFKLGAMLSFIFPGSGTMLVLGGIVGSGMGSWFAERTVTLATRVWSFYNPYIEPEVVELKVLRPVVDTKLKRATSRINEMLAAAANRKNSVRPFFDREQAQAQKEYHALQQSILENPVVPKYGVCFTSRNNGILIWSRHNTWEQYPAENGMNAARLSSP
jgi:hypothetical protein